MKTGRILVLTLLISFFAAGQVFARTSDTASQQTGDSYLLRFQDLGYSDLVLEGGGTAAAEVRFRLPYAWAENGTTPLTLQLTYTTISLQGLRDGTTASANATAQPVPGALDVALNGTNFATIQLESLPPDGRVTLDIPQGLWQLVDQGEEQILQFTLITTTQCLETSRLVIAASSTIDIPYQVVTNQTFTLGRYPQPFAQDSLGLDQVVVVTPASPSVTDMEIAASIMNRLGLLGARPAGIRGTTDTAFDPATDGQNNLIVIGSPDNNSLVRQLAQASVSGLSASNGLVEIQSSPFNSSKAVLIVSGSDEEGKLFAGSALSSEVRVPALVGSKVVITDMLSRVPTTKLPLAGTFRSFGYSSETRAGVTQAVITYDFALPDGYVARPNGYIELHFAHSTPLSEGISSLSVTINGDRVGSVPLDASNSDNGVYRVDLPADMQWWQGRNRVLITIEMHNAINDCDTPLTTLPWTTIFDTSAIFVEAIPESRRIITLDDYPQPFIEDAQLGNVLFVLPQSPEPDTLTAFLQINVHLGGGGADGPSYQPYVTLGMPEETPPARLVISVGRMSANPYSASLNDALPQRFDPATDDLIQAGNPLEFSLPPDEDYGVLELIAPESGPNIATLIVTGTSEESVRWAGSALSVLDLRTLLKGNLAYVQDQRVVSYETRPPKPDEQLFPQPTSEEPAGTLEIPSALPTPIVLPDVNAGDFEQPARPIGTVVAIAIGAGVLILGTVIYALAQRRGGNGRSGSGDASEAESMPEEPPA